MQPAAPAHGSPAAPDVPSAATAHSPSTHSTPPAFNPVCKPSATPIRNWPHPSASAQAWLNEHAPDFPGDPVTGNLGTKEEDQARFEDFANDAPCPALNPETGLCDIYAWRPMTCRVFGPPVRVAEGDGLACCELCFIGAADDQIAASEMHPPHELEEDLLAETGDAGETLVAFALLY